MTYLPVKETCYNMEYVFRKVPTIPSHVGGRSFFFIGLLGHHLPILYQEYTYTKIKYILNNYDVHFFYFQDAC